MTATTAEIELAEQAVVKARKAYDEAAARYKASRYLVADLLDEWVKSQIIKGA